MLPNFYEVNLAFDYILFLRSRSRSGLLANHDFLDCSLYTGVLSYWNRFGLLIIYSGPNVARNSGWPVTDAVGL